MRYDPPESVKDRAPLTMEAYQSGALQTLVEDHIKGSFRLRMRLLLGLQGEAGEVAEVHKKWLRGDYGYEELQQRLASELGDLLWYVATLADAHHIQLDDIANLNLEKLKDRAERDVLKGDGDNR